MAEEVSSFPNDYQVNPSALRELVEAREEVGRPRRLADGKEDLRNPERARETAAEEEKDVSRPDRIEDRVEITQDAFDQNQAAERNRTGTQTEEGRESLQEAQDINPLREPGPSEIRDESDGTAIEVEITQDAFDQNQAAERNRTGTQTEEGRESLQEAQDINPLREPRPSEIRDEPDGTAIETELGQNVSSLI